MKTLSLRLPCFSVFFYSSFSNPHPQTAPFQFFTSHDKRSHCKGKRNGVGWGGGGRVGEKVALSFSFSLSLSHCFHFNQFFLSSLVIYFIPILSFSSSSLFFVFLSFLPFPLLVIFLISFSFPYFCSFFPALLFLLSFHNDV